MKISIITNPKDKLLSKYSFNIKVDGVRKEYNNHNQKKSLALIYEVYVKSIQAYNSPFMENLLNKIKSTGHSKS